ncbi:MAG TPA: hypothetical protein VEU33_36820, partial [Archangium sp.]|nr:hypothetical protein [Archangium sp.]
VTATLEDGHVRSLHAEPLSLFNEKGYYNVHAVPLEHGDAEVRTLLVLEDLSNVRMLEDQLLRAEKLATVGVLAAGVAHEIGTPLGVIRGRAEYMLGKLGGAEHPQGRGLSAIPRPPAWHRRPRPRRPPRPPTAGRTAVPTLTRRPRRSRPRRSTSRSTRPSSLPRTRTGWSGSRRRCASARVSG